MAMALRIPPHSPSPKTLIPKSHPPLFRRRLDLSLFAAPRDRIGEMVSAFDPSIPLARAETPPSSWYTDPAMLDLEYERVFYRGWHISGFSEQVKSPGDFFTGRYVLLDTAFIISESWGQFLSNDLLGNLHYIICRDVNGNLHAFHNVCRHHASLLASGTGKKSCFVCPYHGWTYGLDGALLKATRISGIENFCVKEFALIPLKVATWGPFILLSSEKEKVVDEMENEWVGSAANIMSANGVDCSLKHIARREYTIECNWKVFCDNYLDGGYHVPHAHGELASGLKLESYSTTIFEKVSIQRCDTSSSERGSDRQAWIDSFLCFRLPKFHDQQIWSLDGHQSSHPTWASPMSSSIRLLSRAFSNRG